MSRNEKILGMLGRDQAALQTPCYVFDAAAVLANYAALQAALGTRLVVSLKANSCSELLNRCQPSFTGGVEVASLAELNKVVSGCAGERYVNNPSYDKDLIRAALATKATLLVDHVAQLEAIAQSAGTRLPVQPLVLRLNGSVLAEARASASLVRKDHFGMDLDGVSAAVSRARELGLRIKGIHLFNGSFTFAKTALGNADAFALIVARIEEMLGHPLTYLNLGGGFADTWQDDGFDFAAYRASLKRLPSHLELAHESGRGIFASAGHFLSKVIYEKTVNGVRYFVCDGGLAHNFLLAQTENTFRKYRSAEVFAAAGERTPLAADAFCVGSSCSKDDVIARLPAGSPAPQAGDVLLFDQCGAYNNSYTPVRFLSLPEAREYVVV